ncbi:MAG: PLDc N-terminal domain-containing protein [Bacteroidia bacterium]
MRDLLPTDFNDFLKSGWYLFWIVITAMTIAYIWRMKDKPRSYKIIWTIVVLLVPFLGVGIWLFLGYR